STSLRRKAAIRCLQGWRGIQAHGDLRVDGRGEIVWRRILDTHPEAAARLHGYHGSQSTNRMTAHAVSERYGITPIKVTQLDLADTQEACEPCAAYKQRTVGRRNGPYAVVVCPPSKLANVTVGSAD